MANVAREDGILERIDVDHERGGIRIYRGFNAPVQEVWDAITRPERVAAWLARVEGQPERGNRLRLLFPNCETEVLATVTELQAPSVFEYRWDKAVITEEQSQAIPICRPTDLSSTLVRYELAGLDGQRTLLTLTHRAVPAPGAPAGGSVENVQSHVVIAAWQNHLDLLVDAVRAGAAPAPPDGYTWDWNRIETLRARYEALLG